MERLLLINGISPYIYFLVICIGAKYSNTNGTKILLCVFLAQLFMTLVISIICKDKKKLAKITMINKLIQIPYYVIFFVFSVFSFVLGMQLMGIGIILLPFLIAIDLGVFITTVIPEEACTIKLIADGRISTGKFILFFVGNAFYVVDIILSVAINKIYKNEGVN